MDFRDKKDYQVKDHVYTYTTYTYIHADTNKRHYCLRQEAEDVR